MRPHLLGCAQRTVRSYGKHTEMHTYDWDDPGTRLVAEPLTKKLPVRLVFLDNHVGDIIKAAALMPTLLAS